MMATCASRAVRSAGSALSQSSSVVLTWIHGASGCKGVCSAMAGSYRYWIQNCNRIGSYSPKYAVEPLNWIHP